MKRERFAAVALMAACAGLAFVAQSAETAKVATSLEATVESPLIKIVESERLWPEGKIPDAQEKQLQWGLPEIQWYEAPTNANGACMMLVSGGSYERRCDMAWIDRIARRLTDLGFRCVNLAYRVPRPDGMEIWRTAWQDGQRAVRMVRSEAAKRGYDPERIGVLGFSAGAHLTVRLGTCSQRAAYAKVDATDDVAAHINWAIPIYPAYVLTDGLDGTNTRAGQAIDAKVDPSFDFDAKTCPMCFFHGGADVYSTIGSTRLYRELRKRKIPAEVHIYPDCNHGFMGKWGTAEGDGGKGRDTWFGRAEEFMRQMNFDGKLGEEVSLMKRWGKATDTASAEREELWPEGKIPDAQAKQCVPYIEWFVPSNLTTKAIQIIYSGGGYCGNDPNNFEVAPLRRYLNSKGMAVVTLKYRTPRPANLAKHTSAFQDLQHAIRKVRSEAARRGLDGSRIGIMGSSAGGHLTLMGATSSRVKTYANVEKCDDASGRVQWAIAIYPAYALTDGLEDCNAKGGNEDDSFLAPEFAFDLSTCPILFIHGDSDGWAAMNSIKCWEQLRRMGIQGEVHTLVKRGHCFQAKAAPGTGSYNWMDRVWEFMNAKGFNK